LVENLRRTSPSFVENVKPIADLYDVDGKLKPDADHTSIGEAQTTSIPSSLRHPSPLQHLMLGTDSEDESDSGSYHTGESSPSSSSSSDSSDSSDTESSSSSPSSSSIDSSEDQIQPIVISSDDDDDGPDFISEKSRPNPKKRKRS